MKSSTLVIPECFSEWEPLKIVVMCAPADLDVESEEETKVVNFLLGRTLVLGRAGVKIRIPEFELAQFALRRIVVNNAIFNPKLPHNE